MFTEDIISKLAQDETGKRQYYRPVYSLHKWWARRPGALFRSIILLAEKPDCRLFNINNGSLSASSRYFHNHSLENVIILDPFMGGGTTLAEANRLGAKVIGCDLNPVSFWIVRETLKPVDLERLDNYFKLLEQTAGEKIRALYKTTCIYCNNQADSLYAFWIRYVRCFHCNENVYLFKRTFLNNGLSRNKPPSPANPATLFCPECFALNDWTGKDNCVCKSCGCDFHPNAGTYDKGYYACSQCHKDKISLIRTLEDGQKLSEKLIAVEYWCDKCRERFYKSPDKTDSEKILKIEATVKESKERLIIPKQKILEGSSSVRWRKHNYQYYHEIFNARQLLAFNYLIEAVRTIPDEEYRNAFITIFSNTLEYNNMMTPYNYPHRKLHHLFNYHAMPLTTTPVENSVWGAGKEGAGTFANCYQRYVRAKEYCKKPFDRFKNSRNSVQTIFSETEKISAKFVSSFEELKQTPKGALLLCGDSSELPSIPDKSVNFVITDPPYFDSIHYSELSNFFYVWLHTIIDHHYFKPEHVPTEQEAIGNKGMDKGEQEYKELLSSVFKESGRVLKDNGKLIFTFHHAKERVWRLIHTAIYESGFYVADFFPVMSEYKVNPHIRNKEALDTDLVLICQKKGAISEPLPLLPEKMLNSIINKFGAEISNIDDNRLLLYFIGQLLKTEAVTEEQFTEALTCFDKFLANIERKKKEISVEQHQLELF